MNHFLRTWRYDLKKRKFAFRVYAVALTMADEIDSELSLELFKGPERETSVLGGRQVCFRPLSDNVEGPFQFQIESQGEDCYLQLNSMRLAGKCRIYYTDSVPLEPEADVSIINMFPASLFRSSEVEFNNVLVSELSTAMAGYQAYIQTTLSYNNNAQKTHLQGQLYIPDEAAKFDVLTYDGTKVTVNDYYKELKKDDDPLRDGETLVTVFEGSQAAITEAANDVTEKNAKALADNYTLPDDWDTIDNTAFKTHLKDYFEKVKVFRTTDKDAVMAKVKEEALKATRDYVGKMVNKVKVNNGYVQRRKLILRSREFDFYIPVCSDIFQSDRLLHPSISMKLKLGRATEAFSLLHGGDNKFKIDLQNLRLYGRFIQLGQSIVKQHQTLIDQKKPLVYPIKRTIMRTYNIPQGEMSIYVSNMFFGGDLPKSIIIGFVETEAYHGSYKKNPWNFKHFNLRSAILRVNGESCPADPIKPNFKKNLFMREYLEFYRNIGIDMNDDAGNMITPELYRGGQFFLSFDLTGDQCNMHHHHKTISGAIDFNAVFNEELPVSVTVIVHAVTEAQIEIVKDKNPVVKST